MAQRFEEGVGGTSLNISRIWLEEADRYYLRNKSSMCLKKFHYKDIRIVEFCPQRALEPYDCASLWVLRKMDCYREEK